MDIFEQIFLNVNTWLVVLATGAVVWAIRQVIPEKVNTSKVWRLVIRLAPVLLGGVLAAIPGIRPLPIVSQSIMVGVIGGSFSSTIYEIAREAVPRRFKNMMGARATRMKEIGK
jgi:hypothetical protein